MKRRELIQSLGLLSAHAMFPTVLSNFLSSCANREIPEYSYEFFTAEEMETITGLIDVIIPATNTKSASQVNTHLFLDQVFAKCMTPEQQEVIKTGLAELRDSLASADDKIKYLTEVDAKAYAGDDDTAYFKTIKQYTLIGFFTSQEGTTKASNYVKVPDAYKGEVPVTDNTLNYGRTNLKFYI